MSWRSFHMHQNYFMWSQRLVEDDLLLWKSDGTHCDGLSLVPRAFLFPKLHQLCFAVITNETLLLSLLHGGPPVNNKRVYGKHKSRQTLVPGVVNLVLKLLIIFSSQQYLCQTILWSTQPSEPFFCFPSPIKKRKRTHSLLPDELSWHKYFCQPNVHYFQVRCARSSPQALNLTSVL